MQAFNNTPKHNWDDDVETILEGMKGAFDWEKSPEGYEYWKEIATAISFKSISE